jgi:hypothetical protein
MGVAGLFWAWTALMAAQYDAEAHLLKASGAAAADVRAPSAAIARVKAERQAKERAEKKLLGALKELHKKPDLVERAKIADEQFGSDGSVELTLQLDLTPSPAPKSNRSGAAEQ